MSDFRSSSHVSIARLIFLPALLSLAVTILRLIGERQGWSSRWFSTATGGPIPSGMSWLVGITWLALPFGVCFALRLTAAGRGPKRTAKAVGYAFTGMVILLLVYSFLPRLTIGFPQILVFIWLAFFPQLVFWVAFTILMGSLTGSIAFALLGKRRVADEAQVF